MQVSKTLTAIGLMSGTSLDGIDVALLKTDGETVTRHGPAMTVAYDEKQRSLLRQALADAVSLDDRMARPGCLREAEEALTGWHASAVQAFLQKNGLSSSDIDVIGFHGQTVIHRPERGITVQLGLGGKLAAACGVPVVYDMRANDMFHGGQGAPLVPAYHRALVGGIEKPVALVNIGGVANVTWIGRDGDLAAFDTGPGNALIDDWVKLHTGVARDEGGQLGLMGHVDGSVVAQFLGDGFFEKGAPKSLDRNSFAGVSLKGLSVADGTATLTAVTARSIAMSVQLMPEVPKRWIICGGGRHNKAIMHRLSEAVARTNPINPSFPRTRGPRLSTSDHAESLGPRVRGDDEERVIPAEAIGLDGDAIEAEAWAFLAVRSLRGLPLSYPGTTGVREPVTGGVLARP
jgi:anhydro-N-acetylmuramic acid kinase